MPFSLLRQFHSNCLQNTGFSSEAHSVVSQHLLLSLVKIPKVTNGTGCESLQVVITVCPSIWGSLCQCDTRKITASCANSRLPAPRTCQPCYNKGTQIHIHVHSQRHIIEEEQQSASNLSATDVCMIFTYKYVFALDYPHIESTRGRDAASCSLALLMISLQNGKGHCRGHSKYITAHHCLPTTDWRTHFSVPIALYSVVAVYEWFGLVHASQSLAVTVDLQMTQMQSITWDSSHRGEKRRVKGNWSDL